MTDFECFEKLKECCALLRNELRVDNLAVVYEFACLKYGSAVLSASATILLACSKGDKKDV